ncbi:hypothetical protein AAHB54_24595, partial [Bacillus cereus]
FFFFFFFFSVVTFQSLPSNLGVFNLQGTNQVTCFIYRETLSAFFVRRFIQPRQGLKYLQGKG